VNDERKPVTAAGTVPSPCVSVCALDERSGLCTGCHRTLDEIAAWSLLDDDGKRAVLAAAAARRGGAGAARDGRG
jgi:predicted Fe-S protein YdhL (DUF1289 family)